MRSNRRVMVAFVLMAGAFVMMLVLMAVILSDTARVEAKETGSVHYESVLIEDGDSLWSVAEEYKGTGEKTGTFAKKLAGLNGICIDSKLHKGSYLLVPVA